MPDKHYEVALSFLQEGGTNFPRFPKLVEDLVVFHMPDGLGMQFRGLSNPVVLRGALAETLLPKLLPLLNGEYEVADLFEKLSGEASPGEVAGLLKNLFTRGAIADPDRASASGNIVDRKHQLFLGRRLGVTRNNRCPSEVVEKLGRARVVVIADGLLGAAVIDLLNRSGFENLIVAALKTQDASEELFSGFPSEINILHFECTDTAVRTFLQKESNSADLVVAALRNVPQSVHLAINEACIQSGTQWLRTCDNGSNVEVGPYVNPYDSPCLECMLVRQISVSDYAVEEELYQEFLQGQVSVSGLLGESLGLATQAASYIAQEAVRIVTAIEKPQLDGTVLIFHSDGTIDRNGFNRVPRCEVCARGGAISVPERDHASKVS